MDTETLRVILASILGGGGLAGLITAVRAKASKKGGQPKTEGVAVAAQSPDWAALNNYWKRELSVLRLELARTRQMADERAERDERYIDQLESHIWQKLPPPPPARDKGKS
jgi:hypothetical protein